MCLPTRAYFIRPCRYPLNDVGSRAGQHLPFVQYVVCLAVVAALQEAFSARLGNASAASQFSVRIKWPNDIYAITSQDTEPVKIGGILCHSISRSGEHNVVVGLGLNVDNSEPTTSVNALLASAAPQDKTPGAISRGEALALTLNHLEDFLAVCSPALCLSS